MNSNKKVLRQRKSRSLGSSCGRSPSPIRGSFVSVSPRTRSLSPHKRRDRQSVHINMNLTESQMDRITDAYALFPPARPFALLTLSLRLDSPPTSAALPEGGPATRIDVPLVQPSLALPPAQGTSTEPTMHPGLRFARPTTRQPSTRSWRTEKPARSESGRASADPHSIPCLDTTPPRKCHLRAQPCWLSAGSKKLRPISMSMMRGSSAPSSIVPASVQCLPTPCSMRVPMSHLSKTISLLSTPRTRLTDQWFART